MSWEVQYILRSNNILFLVIFLIYSFLKIMLSLFHNTTRLSALDSSRNPRIIGTDMGLAGPLGPRHGGKAHVPL